MKCLTIDINQLKFRYSKLVSIPERVCKKIRESKTNGLLDFDLRG